MASQYIQLPQVTGGSGAVDSVNGLTGVVVLTKSNIGLGNVDNTSDLNKPISTDTQTALDAKQDEILGINNTLVVKNSSGVVESLPNFSINTSGGINQNLVGEVSTAGSITMDNRTYDANATENAPNNTFTSQFTQVNIDTVPNGFDLGTNGTGITIINNNVVHSGESNIGGVEFLKNSFSLGNGIDPIDVKGIAYAFGFGQVNANVNISGPIQGYGFQPNVDGAATMGAGSYVNSFYDYSNMNVEVSSYTSYAASPTIDQIANNGNYSGINLNPTINDFNGNSGFNGVAVAGQLGNFNTGSYNGVNINSTATGLNYAVGVNVNMDNITVNPGVAASKVIQDLTIAADAPGTAANSVTIEYTGGGTAGSEVVSNTGLAFEVQIEDGVSTAQNIADALNAYAPFTLNLNVTISGTAGNTQTIQGPVNLEGGVNPGIKQAAYLDGDVEITGNLTFGGALSIGQLNAYTSEPLSDGGGTPASIHSLISAVTAANNATIANADTIGVNTACLIQIGDNAAITSSFLGIAALGLPAVVTLGSGATVDNISGAAFAVSLDATAGGGTVDTLDLCRAIAIPNGVTAITNLIGFKMDLPFGDPGSTTWGVYITPSVNNYMAGSLLVGGTAGSDDTVQNNNVGIELDSTSKAILLSRMTTAQRDAMTAIDGMIIYNTTTSKLQGYAGATWVDLH